MIPGVDLTRPAGCPLTLHKRQGDPVDTSLDAVDSEHRHSEINRLIR